MDALQPDGQTRPAFFRLPLELRQEIYSLAYPPDDKKTVDLLQYTESGKRVCLVEKFQLEVCQQWRTEAVDWIFRRKTPLLGPADPADTFGRFPVLAECVTNLQTLWIYETFRYTDLHLCSNLRKLEIEVVPAVFTGELYPTKYAIPYEVQREMRSIKTFPRLPEQTEIFVTPCKYLLDDEERMRIWEENVRVLQEVLRERVRGGLEGLQAGCERLDMRS